MSVCPLKINHDLYLEMILEKAETVTEEILNLYQQFGDRDYIGEAVSQMEHMSQAAELAMNEGMEDEVILAAFFHDIGHICVQQDQVNTMKGYGVKSHEKIGADYLRHMGYPEKVARLVEMHVEAKRYLTIRYPEYYAGLSEASKQTLEFQGGKMTDEEASAFERDPLFQIAIKLRQWDEQAKETDQPLTDLHRLKAISIQVLTRQLPWQPSF